MLPRFVLRLVGTVLALTGVLGVSCLVSCLAQGLPSDILTTYATTKGACSGDPQKLVELAENRITGPGFSCTLANGRPAGTGLVAYDGTCTVDGANTPGTIALDLGNYSDHFKLLLPGRDGWISLYPCTPVGILESRRSSD